MGHCAQRVRVWVGDGPSTKTQDRVGAGRASARRDRPSPVGASPGSFRGLFLNGFGRPAPPLPSAPLLELSRQAQGSLGAGGGGGEKRAGRSELSPELRQEPPALPAPRVHGSKGPACPWGPRPPVRGGRAERRPWGPGSHPCRTCFLASTLLMTAIILWMALLAFFLLAAEDRSGSWLFQ